MEEFVRPKQGILYAHTALNDTWVTDYVENFVTVEDRIATHNQAMATGYRAIAGAKTNGGLMDLSDRLQSSVTAAGEHAAGVTKEVGEKLGGFTKSVGEKLETVTNAYLGPDGKFSRVLDDFEKAIADKFGPNSKEMVEFRERNRRDFATHGKALLDEVRGIMNPADEKSPIGMLNRAINGIDVKIAQLQTKVDSQGSIAKAQRAIPLLAGKSLEAFVNEVIAPIASVHGETFDDVRDVHSTTAERRKVGDFVTVLDGRLTRGAIARVVMEAKNRKSATVSGLLKELDDAMQGRQALAAVGILTNINARCRPITAYGGNKVIVTLPGFGDPNCDYEYFASLLELGYEYGRLLASARATMTSTDAIDLEAILAGVDELSEAAKGFKELADNHTRIITAVDAAKATSTAMKNKIASAGQKLRTVIQTEIERVKSKSLPPSSNAA